MAHIDLNNTLSDRALVLSEKGLENWQIAERLGIRRTKVAEFINHALKKRERMHAEAAQ